MADQADHPQEEPEVLEPGADLERVADPSDRARPPAGLQRFPSLHGMSLERLGEVFAASGFFTDARDPARAMVKIIAGAELGLSPFASMTGIHVIGGKPVVGGQLLAGILKTHPRYRMKVARWDRDECEVVMYERDDGTGEWVEQTPRSVFTLEDAATANLLGRDNWKHHPRNMLLWRAVTNAVRLHAPDVFGGTPVYTPDELGVEIQPDGSVIGDGAATPSARAALPPTPRASAPGTAARGQGPPQPTATAAASEKVINASQRRKLWKLVDGAGIRDQENLIRAILVYVTGENSSERVPASKVSELFAAIEDHEGTLEELCSLARQGASDVASDEARRARAIVEHYLPHALSEEPPSEPEDEGDEPQLEL